MPEVLKTIRAADGTTFQMRFWDDGSGTLVPIHEAQIKGQDAALNVQFPAAQEMKVTGSIPAGDDVTGTGNAAAQALGATVQYVDCYNYAATEMTVAAGGITRRVPGQSGRLLFFPAATATVAVTAAGDWILTPCQ